MRFIGSKKNLLDKIDSILQPHLDGTESTFIDLFAGSNAVGNYFSSRYQIISNDIMYFSYVLAKGTLCINEAPKFSKLSQAKGISDPLQYLSSYPLNDYSGDFVTNEYSPAGKAHRMYFTIENAKRIDFCRTTIEVWYKDNIITENEYFYLLAALISAIPFVSNITGTYGAYLKKWDKRAFKKLTLTAPLLDTEIKENTAYNQDSLSLISKLQNRDIVYIDTPYNTRQYPSNYHVLETIARWNKPELKGVTGQPNLNSEKSDFAVKRKAADAMEKLLAKVTAKHVVISYSTDGIIPISDLESMIKKAAKNGQVEVNKFNYRKYKGKLHNNKQVYELLFYYQPSGYVDTAKQEAPSHVDKPKKKLTAPKGFIKGPLNYVGGKYKLLPQIFPYFPSNINTFIDLFSGGANVGINVKANRVVFNDINSKINELFRYIQNNDVEEILKQIYGYIDKYHLSKTNEKGFKLFRDDYNSKPNPIALYTLVSYSFNYQFRFNNELQYNNPFGKNRSHFSKRMEQNLINFTERLHSMNAVFTDDYFTKLDLSNLKQSDFVYADPPYLITTGSYNDGNRGFVNWKEEQDKQLRHLLDSLNAKGIRFALSNVLKHKGAVNNELIQWSEQYNVHHLNYDYSNSSHNTSHLGSDEVLITNY